MNKPNQIRQPGDPRCPFPSGHLWRVEELVVLFASYETDEPHCGDDEPYAPTYSWRQITEWLQQEHDGENAAPRSIADAVPTI